METGNQPRRPLKRFVKLFVPPRLAKELVSELKIKLVYWKSWFINRRKFKGLSGLRLNIGCGPNQVPGWINIDVVKGQGILQWDIREKLPFDDNSAEIIFAEHVFEHLEPDGDAESFLSECIRCLMPGGVLRLVVPDAGLYLKLYAGSWDDLVNTRPLIPQRGSYADSGYEGVITYRTQMELINFVFRQFNEHKFAYDAETLMMKLKDAGFSKVSQQSYGVSAASAVTLDTPARKAESLYVEGIK